MIANFLDRSFEKNENGKWTSPLKNLDKLEHTVRKVRMICLDELPAEVDVPVTIEITDKFLFKNYQYNFSFPPFGVNVKNFFAIRDQVMEIEKMLYRLDNVELNEKCRIRIRGLLYNGDYDYKISELGMILFYLDSSNDIPDEELLVAYRAKVLQKEADSYIRSHKDNELDSRIPNGATHYLLRAFAHMALTSMQVFNRGGLVAIETVLTVACHKIVKYLQPEHAAHIVIIVRQILSDNNFEKLFNSKVTVHKSLEDLIRLDLKLARIEGVESVHVFYDCLMALFADVRQENTPNCYAVSSLIYATENNTYDVFNKILDWLKTGHCLMGELNSIPICPLIEERLSNSKDFEIFVDPVKIKGAVPIQHMRGVLDLPETIKWKKPKVTLKELLNVAEEGRFVEQMFYCYKYSGLMHMQVALIEFMYTNSIDTKHRHEVIEACIAGIEDGGYLKLQKDVRTKIEDKLSAQLWLENRCESGVRFEGGELWVGTQKIRGLKGSGKKLEALFRLLERSLRVISLDSRGGYHLIYSISDLKDVVIEVVKEAIKELSFTGRSREQEKKGILKVVESERYKTYLANFCAKKIKDEQIEAEDLKKADLMILNQRGGIESISLRLVYGIEISKHRIDQCLSPYQFLENLLKWMQSMNLDNIRRAPKILISTRGNHSWTLTPSCWELLLQYRNSFRNFIQETMFDPAKKRLASLVSPQLIRNVIKRFAKDRITTEKMTSYFSDKGNMTFAMFRDELISHTDDDHIQLVKDIIEDEFSKVSISLNDLTQILARLGIKILSKALEKLFRVIPCDELSPSVLAKKLRLALIEEGIQVVNPYQLELCICDVKKLPLLINVGDLNWVINDEHEHLLIKISYVWGIPKFFCREGVVDIIQGSDNFTNFVISHPSSLLPVNNW